MPRPAITTTSSPIGPTSPTARTSSTSGCCRWKSAASGTAPASSQHNVGTPATLRLGLSEWIEARISSDGFLSATDPSGTQRGIGNVQIGAKLRLWADPGGVPVLSILPTVNLPAASESKGLGSGQADYTVAVLTGTDFLTRGHIDINYGMGRIGAGTGLPRFTQQLVSWSASAEVPGPVTPYVEGFWFSRQDPDGGPVVAHGWRRHLRDQPAARPRRRRPGRPDGCRAGTVRLRRVVGRGRQRPGRPRRARAPARGRQARRRAGRGHDDTADAPGAAPVDRVRGRAGVRRLGAAHPRAAASRPRRCSRRIRASIAPSRCRTGSPRPSIARRARSSSAWSPTTSIKTATSTSSPASARSICWSGRTTAPDTSPDFPPRSVERCRRSRRRPPWTATRSRRTSGFRTTIVTRWVSRRFARSSTRRRARRRSRRSVWSGHNRARAPGPPALPRSPSAFFSTH